ncbi:MAG TPA: hypothetical protein VHQ70_01465 [Syntrophomonadaceae bacterium]|nr:hypothetical protein [Syntrophomonadaceae bacterium]
MIRTTISTKVPVGIVSRIAATGYSVSNVIQISLEMFLDLPPEQQKNLIDEHIRSKTLERVRERFPERRSD